VSIRGHMSRRSFGEGGFVVSKNKNALPGISRQGALKISLRNPFPDYSGFKTRFGGVAAPSSHGSVGAPGLPVSNSS
jgi:hypothetical protein